MPIRFYAAIVLAFLILGSCAVRRYEAQRHAAVPNEAIRRAIATTSGRVNQ